MGYVAADTEDGLAHVAQMSRAPAWAGREIGRRFMAAVEPAGRDSGGPASKGSRAAR